MKVGNNNYNKSKLPNFLDLPEFQWIRSQMNIPRNYPVDFSLNLQTSERYWDDILFRGLEITVDDQDFEIFDDGFSYQGRRVLVYIRDQQAQYAQPGHSNYKYHLTWCRTLENMARKGRFKKYVVSTNTDGYFQINYIEDNKVVDTNIEHLSVCKNCLTALDWKNYQSLNQTGKNDVYNNFNLEEFFKVYSNDNLDKFHIIPDDTDISAPPNIYPPDWKVISAQYKRWQDMRCSKCNRKFTSKSELHCHHKNGIKSDCSPSNLEVLCPNCHQEEHPEHKIFGSNNYKNSFK